MFSSKETISALCKKAYKREMKHYRRITGVSSTSKIFGRIVKIFWIQIWTILIGKLILCTQIVGKIQEYRNFTDFKKAYDVADDEKITNYLLLANDIIIFTKNKEDRQKSLEYTMKNELVKHIG